MSPSPAVMLRSAAGMLLLLLQALASGQRLIFLSSFVCVLTNHKRLYDGFEYTEKLAKIDRELVISTILDLPYFIISKFQEVAISTIMEHLPLHFKVIVY